MFTAADIDPTAMNSPKFRLIAVQCIFAVTTFSAMASQHRGLAGPDSMTLEECGPLGCGYSKFAMFKFMVAIFILYFIFTLLAMGVYLFQKVPAPVTEFGCYALFNLLMFTAFVSCAAECNTTIVDPEYPVCKRATGAKAAVAFSFLTWAATSVSMLFTFKEWRDSGYESMPEITTNFEYMPGRGNAATTQTFA